MGINQIEERKDRELLLFLFPCMLKEDSALQLNGIKMLETGTAAPVISIHDLTQHSN